MNEFEARYKLLVAKADPKHVEATDRLVQRAIQLSAGSLHPLCDVVEAMLAVILTFNRVETEKGNIVMLARWADRKAGEFMENVSKGDKVVKTDVELLKETVAKLPTEIEWQAIIDALMFTSARCGCVSDAHIRVVDKVEVLHEAAVVAARKRGE